MLLFLLYPLSACNFIVNLIYFHYYPHMPIGMLWIYRLLFVCLFFLCPQDFGNVVTDISGVG